MTEIRVNDKCKNVRRNTNFDLMGILLMILIILGHVAMYNERLPEIGSADYYVINLVRSFCVMAVNVFVIRSGYFGITLKWDKMLRFDLCACFYTWMGLVIGILCDIHEISFMKDIKLLFPVITKQYWYLTTYLALCILSPYINTFLKNTDKRTLRSFLTAGFFLFYMMATFCFLINANQLVMDAGYGIVNFVYLYCLGYYIRNYYDDKKPGRHVLIYVFSCLLIYFINAGLSKLLGFYFNAMISYNTIFVLLASASAFLVFKNIHVPEKKWISKLASKTLAVYIIHTNPVLSKAIFVNMLRVDTYSGIELAIVGIAISAAIFLVAAMIDMVVDFALRPIESMLGRIVQKQLSKYRR